MAIINDNIYVSMIYYIADKQCQIYYIHGHSMALVKKLLEICVQNEINKIFVSILPDCGSDKLFEKMGFQFTDNNNMCFTTQ